MSIGEISQFLLGCVIFAVILCGLLAFFYAHRWPTEGTPAKVGTSFPYRAAHRPTVRRGTPPRAVWIPALLTIFWAPIGVGYGLTCLVVATLLMDPRAEDAWSTLVPLGLSLMALVSPIISIVFLRAGVTLMKRKENAQKCVRQAFVGSVFLVALMAPILVMLRSYIQRYDLVLLSLYLYPICTLGFGLSLERTIRNSTEGATPSST